MKKLSKKDVSLNNQETDKKSFLKWDKFHNLLNKDVKDMNKISISLFAIGILFLAGFISYKLTNSSYALFSDSIKGEKTIEIGTSSKTTVLYSDGTLIINELDSNRASNTTKHGEVTKEYKPWEGTNDYVFNSEDNQPWKDERESIISVEIGSKIRPTSTAYWMSALSNMEKGDFSKLDTSQVTDMSYMFFSAGEYAPTFNIDGLSNWNTSSVTNMSDMFSGAALSAPTFDIGNLSNWDTSQVTNMSDMFGFAGSMGTTTFDIGNLSNWNTSKVTDMSYMFYGAGSSASTFNIGDLSNWDTSSVTNMSDMFSDAGNRATTFDIGNLSNWNTSKVTDMSNMFSGAGQYATTFNIGDLSKWNTSQVTDMSNMFYVAGQNATWSLDCSKWNVNKVTSYDGFNNGVESKVTPPVWVN